jgi:membrane-bound metal-dependent hydrolase YbcI (DUF457 family)
MTTIAHTALGILGWQWFAERKNWRTLFLFAVIASLPDIDFGLFIFWGKEGFRYHQYYTHNVFFVMVTSLLFWPFLKSKRERWGFLLVGYSHLVLDFFTIDGAAPYGFPAFFPFWEHRFNFGVLPNVWKANLAEVFSLHNAYVAGFEILVFWAPVVWVYRKAFLSYLKQEELRRF